MVLPTFPQCRISWLAYSSDNSQFRTISTNHIQHGIKSGVEPLDELKHQFNKHLGVFKLQIP
ncbi:hypothetical protein BDP55DRAFT_661333 [Colletotrichum godetiae]|uniref:Uncharacterized protein n=1 Tax=Colletotrichum godetiae TaxID=1209918 RepID=A0AAJ0ANH2_9PEZI|nr:uncharacterized protein BDP55DRAFT_661333 [Colletotrichum godetiae]KAK1676490.1 hypothetical protein BDP55DRAFT_661333 [Colletotrichum godetiae]